MTAGLDGFVADASVAIAWVHPGQATADTDRLLEACGMGARIEVPALWPLEVANALLVLERRGKLSAGERREALDLLGGLPVRVDHEGAGLAFGTLSELATRSGLSLYDTAYLECAMRRRLPLACKDGLLRAAAPAFGVHLLP